MSRGEMREAARRVSHCVPARMVHVRDRVYMATLAELRRQAARPAPHPIPDGELHDAFDAHP